MATFDKYVAEALRCTKEAPLTRRFLCYDGAVLLRIPIPEKISLNAIYAGVHFRKRSEHKDAYYWSVLSVSPERYSGVFPVACHYHFKLRGTPLDIMNHAYMAKMVEDALVACEVLPDDTPKFISRVTFSAEKVGKNDDDEVVVHILSPLAD